MKNEIVSPEQWLAARKALLQKEKEFTRLRDQLSAARQALPWERVEADYVFNGPDGRVSLEDLFDGRSQLIIYHFMYGPDWDDGCKSCSFLADHADPAVVHLNHRDVSFVAVSRAPIETLEAYKMRMGWHFPWVSSLDSSFNEDFNVSFSKEAVERGDTYYNYARKGFPSTEAPGASVFYRNESGAIFHTYSVFERGLDMFLTTYHYLDIVPKGRDEDGLNYTMEWIRRHDEY
ncbi:MAG TPA: thioredoxin family protein [Gammaproteobacteria bacterium]|nr:thioredoxin family protein [Gammaproteobacteria bacterium]